MVFSLILFGFIALCILALTIPGDPLKYSGINSVGLRRRDFSSEQRRLIKNVYKVIYRSKLNITQALKELKTNFESTEEVLKIINFIETCERGII